VSARESKCEREGKNRAKRRCVLALYPHTPTFSLSHTTLVFKGVGYDETETYSKQYSHCNTLQHSATHCNILQHTATHYNALQHPATHCNKLQQTATRCNLDSPRLVFSKKVSMIRASMIPLVLPYLYCSALQGVAVCCSVLQCEHDGRNEHDPCFREPTRAPLPVMWCVAVCCNVL